MVQTFYNSLETPHWLWWNFHCEKVMCQDTDDTDSLWYALVIKAIDALNANDWAEVERTIQDMADNQGVNLVSESVDIETLTEE